MAFNTNRQFNRNSQKSQFRRKHNFRNQSNRKHKIDPQLLVKKATYQPQKQYIATHTFSDFMLESILSKNISARGYEKPTQIQDQSIPEIQKGSDIVGIADTGTGKTAAFLIPLINKIILHQGESALIMVPTRELASQIEDEFRSLVKNTGIFSQVCIGGVPLGKQIRGLKHNPHFVIGTPGRLIDLYKRGHLNFGSYQNAVVDEFDRMLDMGFIKDVRQILLKLPERRQLLFFSATIPNEVRDLVNNFLKNPIHISVKSQGASPNVDQNVIKVRGKTKFDVLVELLQGKECSKVLVFCRTKRGVDKVTNGLAKKNIAAGVIHGDKSQFQRQKALEMFKGNKIQVLIATDIASRGLHIDQVSHVINYDLPETYEDYTHRIGRTGRLDQKGTAITLID